jgi:hypothetical protein
VHIDQGAKDFTIHLPINFTISTRQSTNLYDFARSNRVAEYPRPTSQPAYFLDRNIAKTRPARHKFIDSLLSTSKLNSPAMPYNNTPIAPSKDVTGHVSLPRELRIDFPFAATPCP